MEKVKAFCLNSLTVAWGYFMAVAGAAIEMIEAVADGLGNPAIKEQLSAALGGDPKTIGRVLLGVSIVTILARLRSIGKVG